MSHVNHLNDRQREAVLATEGPILVIAGAGSGKTRVLTERITHLVNGLGVSPYEILAFTFTNKAAREMKDRLERSASGATERMWVGTFHATGVRILRRHGEAAGIRRDFSIYDTDDSMGLVKSILSRFPNDARFIKSPRMLRERISRMKNDLITPSMAADRAGGMAEQRVAALYAEYEKELRRANALDFDDLIMKVVELFAANDEVRDLYARRFRYILVDEFQDTNAIQMAMIDYLASHHHNLFVVGDDDQSIYSWRGARVEHILEFEGVYADTRVIRLEQNYRSTKTILDAANGVIAHNLSRKGKNLWTEGEVGEKVRVTACTDEEAEAFTVLDLVKRAVAAGANPRDIAILYRTNAQSRALEDVFKLGSMPYQIIGGVRFYERAEVRDVMAYCKALANPADSISLKRIINVPRRGIGKSTIDSIEAYAVENNISMIDAMHAPGLGLGSAAASRCRAFLEVFERLYRAAETEVAPHVVSAILTATNYMKYLEEAYPDADVRTENVEEFLSAAHAYAEGAEDKSLRAFMEEVALVADVDSIDLESGQLTLMTLHNAKGLEFDTVIVTGLEEGLFPHYNSIDDADAVEEERRLFYVGMTRARRRLHVTFAGMRRRMGMMEGGVPSRFLAEIPERCLEAPLEPVVSRTGSLFDGGSAWSRARSIIDEYAQTAPRDEDTYSQEVHYAPAPAQAPAPRPAVRAARYEVGTRVLHDRFGKGIVRRVEGQGEQLRVTVIFDTGGERKFIAQYAPMRPL
ncbi:MAG TPA: UvrD-helicase domain-containing protein [Candidatus Krumholzibacteria bacterium]|nr:UvrD-helicase domain-containing protein [Candidatus Krumholzibacteria bacterium]